MTGDAVIAAEDMRDEGARAEEQQAEDAGAASTGDENI